jgi:hypothetical protein
LAPTNNAKGALTVKIWVGDKIEQNA